MTLKFAARKSGSNDFVTGRGSSRRFRPIGNLTLSLEAAELRKKSIIGHVRYEPMIILEEKRDHFRECKDSGSGK